MTKLSRAQISRKLPKANNIVDTTIKSSTGLGKNFAPTWNMVMGHKSGKISDEEYVKLYLPVLNKIPYSVWEELSELGENVILICYCRDEWFCHTKLIIKYAIENYPELFEKGD